MHARMTTTSCGATGTHTAVHLFQKILQIGVHHHTRLAGKTLEIVWLYLSYLCSLSFSSLTDTSTFDQQSHLNEHHRELTL